MEISPRSSTTTLSTTSSQPIPLRTLPTSESSTDANTSAARPPRENFSSYLPIPSHESDCTNNQKASIPYVELEKQEREQEEREEKGRQEKRRIDESHLNAYSECGRHGDDWLFGGASVTDSVKWLLGKR